MVIGMENGSTKKIKGVTHKVFDGQNKQIFEGSKEECLQFKKLFDEHAHVLDKIKNSLNVEINRMFVYPLTIWSQINENI